MTWVKGVGIDCIWGVRQDGLVHALGSHALNMLWRAPGSPHVLFWYAHQP